MTTSAFRRFVYPAIPTVLGFGIGWYGFSAADNSGFVPESYKNIIARHAIAAQNCAVVNCFPESLTKALAWENVPKTYQMFLEYERRAAEGHNSTPFGEILLTCQVQEQLEWLSDHANPDDIPYIDTCDLFNAWALLYEEQLALAEEAATAETKTEQKNKDVEVLVKKKGPNFFNPAPLPTPTIDSMNCPELTKNVWAMTIEKMLPVGLGLRCLAVLTINERNALALNRDFKRIMEERAPRAKTPGSGNSEDPPAATRNDAEQSGGFVEKRIALDFSSSLGLLDEGRKKDSKSGHAASNDQNYYEDVMYAAALRTIRNIVVAESNGRAKTWWRSILFSQQPKVDIAPPIKTLIMHGEQKSSGKHTKEVVEATKSLFARTQLNHLHDVKMVDEEPENHKRRMDSIAQFLSDCDKHFRSTWGTEEGESSSHGEEQMFASYLKTQFSRLQRQNCSKEN